MNDQQFNELLQSVQDMGRHMRDEHVAGAIERKFSELNVKAIRERSGLSPIHFAHAIGVNPRKLKSWEQRRVNPTGPAQALFKIIEANPDAISVLG